MTAGNRAETAALTTMTVGSRAVVAAWNDVLADRSEGLVDPDRVSCLRGAPLSSPRG